MIMERLRGAEAEELYDRHLDCLQMGLPCPDLGGEPCWFCEDDDDCDSDDDWEEEEEEEEEQQRPPQSGPTTFCGFKKSFLCQTSASVAPACDPPEDLFFAFGLPQKQQLTAEEAEKNAEELVAEEERIKKKAEKKRMKKKRQKDRRRQEKLDRELKAKDEAEESSPWCGDGQNEDSLPSTACAVSCSFPGSEEVSSTEASLGGSPSRTTEETMVEEELDLSSTFVSKARLKAGNKPLPPKKEKTLPPDRKEVEDEKVKQEVDSGPTLRMSPVDQSMVLADCGTETAKQGHYQEAVLLFTEAVKLNPREYRFFGNRSFCYERLHCYAEALRDAQLALSLQPGWPKGLFRQGKALMGLKRYVEAARTFESLLHWGDFRGDAAVQLRRCQVQHLLENGFSSGPPDWNPLPREAPLPLSGGQQNSRPITATSVCGSSTQPEGHLASLTITSSGGKLKLPSAEAPVRACFPVWVGNLTPRITQEVLLHHFQPFGPIHSIRHLPRRFCAFINYIQKEAAEAAFATLQGVEVEGSTFLLQLKHPLHATPAHAKVPSSSLQPLRWDPAWNPPTSAASSWLHSVGHLH